MRFSEEELTLLKNTFKDNTKLLKLLRKVFLPEYNPLAPLGQNIDLWMTVDVRNLTPQDAMIRILARNELITHIEQQLMQIKVLVDRKEESSGEIAERRKKDSAK